MLVGNYTNSPSPALTWKYSRIVENVHRWQCICMQNSDWQKEPIAMEHELVIIAINQDTFQYCMLFSQFTNS